VGGRAALGLPAFFGSGSLGENAAINDLADLQPVLLSELKVTSVVSRHPHDRSCTVLHHDIVGDIDGDFFVLDGVDRVAPGEDALFLDRRGAARDLPLL
jgi:hypothetical protein